MGCSRNQPLQNEQYFILRQEYPSQRVRDQTEMDAPIAHRLQAEEQVRDKYSNFQLVRQVIQSAQAPFIQQ